MEEREDGK